MCLWTARTPQCLGGEMLAQRWEADGHGALGVCSVSPPAAMLIGLRPCGDGSAVQWGTPCCTRLASGPAIPLCSRSRPTRDGHILHQMRPSVQWKRPELFIQGHCPKSEADKQSAHRACAPGGWFPPAVLCSPRFTYTCEPFSCYLC